MRKGGYDRLPSHIQEILNNIKDFKTIGKQLYEEKEISKENLIKKKFFSYFQK
mgnify:CR=1 FL=1